ncbi:NUDIX domain-containing protein [Mucilaginibacter glaciei]|uniref:NUDIX domain-containing protein n=1 Tax=Mucilaginibacter glaciei TaxID=2772109 RepID=A0A926NRN8_9SPHI|nr:NUDIX domain-containing protein [Mucilaginibacter glaciei]MBD1394786.1 NUDIX domain-containing protein [Mucilaginibacter glaciei]
MPKQSAGIVLYRIVSGQTEIFLVHPGGPFWKNKDDGAWSIPKGEYTDDEEPLLAARREFAEETGQEITGDFVPLKPVKQKSGKVIHAWAVVGDLDHTNIKSNLFEMEWPPKSGKLASFEEVDRADWFDLETAKIKINPGQVRLIEELKELV